MRFANHAGRLTRIATGPGDELDGAAEVDVHEASGGNARRSRVALQVWDAVLAGGRAPALEAPVTIQRPQLASPSQPATNTPVQRSRLASERPWS